MPNGVCINGHYRGLLNMKLDAVTADKWVRTVDLAFRLTMGHFFNTTRQNMMSSFVLNVPECRITLCQSKIFRFMHVILFFLCSGNYMVWKGNMISRTPFLLWRVYGYL